MISKNDDYRTILTFVAFHEKSDYFAIFLNFQVTFTSWRHVITKNGCQNSPLEFSHRIQKSNWFCSSTLGKCPNQHPISMVLKLQFLRERGLYGWCQSPGKCFFGFKNIQRWSKNGGAFQICKDRWGAIKPHRRSFSEQKRSWSEWPFPTAQMDFGQCNTENF